MSRLKEMYKNEIMDAMTKKFGYKNVMEVPKLDKIVINMGLNIFDFDTLNGKFGTMKSAKATFLSQDRKQSLLKLKNLSLTLKSERVCRSVVKLH